MFDRAGEAVGRLLTPTRGARVPVDPLRPSSIADSPTRPGQPERALYAPEAVDDIADAARAASPTDPSNVVLVGVCSGAYAALAAVPRIRPRAVVAVNPLMTEWGEENASQAAGSEPAPRLTPASLGAAIRDRLRRSSLKGKIVDHLPPLLWRVVFALNLAHSPVRLLAPVWKAKVPTLLICGEEEARLPKARSPRALRRLGADHISRFEELPTLNHSLLHSENRATIYSMLFAFIQAGHGHRVTGNRGPQATENPSRAPSRVKRFPSVRASTPRVIGRERSDDESWQPPDRRVQRLGAGPRSALLLAHSGRVRLFRKEDGRAASCQTERRIACGPRRGRVRRRRVVGTGDRR